MTKTSSTADFFLRYCRYKIINGRMLAAFSTVLSILAFFQYGIALKILSSKLNNTADTEYLAELQLNYSENVLELALFALFLLAIFIGLKSFGFYIQGHETDMLGSLPISHSMRFFGDFISGYVMAVVPFAVFSAVSLPLISSAEKELGTTLYTEYTAYVFLTMFFAISAAYVIGVLAASVCGRMISALACTALFIIAFSIIIPSICGFVIDSIAGIAYTSDTAENTYYFYEAASFKKYIPSFLVFTEDMSSWGNINPFSEFTPFTDDMLNVRIGELAAGEGPVIIIWTAELIALSAAAFFITKFRKAERTGSAFGYKYGYYGILAFSVFVSACIAISLYSYGNYAEHIIVIAVLSVVIFAVFEISMRRGWKNFGRGAVVLAGAFAVVSGMLFITRYTGCFGLRSSIPATNDIVSAQFDNYVFTDKEDIAQLRENHSEFLKKYGNEIESPIGVYNITNPMNTQYGTHMINYTLENGKTFTRIYRTTYSYFFTGSMSECRKALSDMPKTLSGYPEQVVKYITEIEPYKCRLEVKGIFGGIDIKPEKINEFAKIYAEDFSGVSEKGEQIGKVSFGLNYGEDKYTEEVSYELEIYRGFEKTLAYAGMSENVIPTENDEETICYTARYYYSGYEKDSEFDFCINIRKKDLETPAGKELLTLIKEESSDSNGKIKLYANDWSGHTVSVSKADEKRFCELMADLVLKNIDV